MRKEHNKAVIALGARVRELRISRGVTQRQLASFMGKDRQSLCRLEKGQVNPGYLWLLDLCDALEIDLEELVSGLQVRNQVVPI